MKTAMQELIDWVDENSPHCKIDSLVREVAEKLLEKEQQQIKDAFDDGQANWDPKCRDYDNGNHYYNSL